MVVDNPKTDSPHRLTFDDLKALVGLLPPKPPWYDLIGQVQLIVSDWVPADQCIAIGANKALDLGPDRHLVAIGEGTYQRARTMAGGAISDNELAALLFYRGQLEHNARRGVL